ncbi:MAG: pre-peptidase C-terminal domain-containing protein [Pirellulaceae bacterium]|nr:pre-peptidase C-terminal domain-containing protein [Pirellulaceae bacterium]
MAKGGFFKSLRLPSVGRTAKRDSVRRVLLEALETRQLLAAGPQLIGVQPNAGSLLDSGDVLSVSPRELVFRFDDAVGLDPETLSGIRIVRSGADGLFERAAVATDFGTNGQTLVEFYAREVGEAGNGIRLHFTTASRSDSRLPRVSVVGRTINVELNNNPLLQTRVQDLLQAFSYDGAVTAASPLVYALRLRGSDTIAISPTADTSRDFVLAGAGAGKAATDFGLGNTVSVDFVAREPGNAGVGIRIHVTSRDRGGAANPIVTVSGKTINVEVNSHSRFPTTIQEFVDAINSSDSLSSTLIEARLVSGAGAIRIGGQPTTYSPIVLGGVSEVEIQPGYVGLGDTDREVVLRFAERLPQSQYRIDILGRGTRALRNVDGQVFNDGVSRTIVFGLNLGARIESVVPQPVFRNSSGQLVQNRNQIDLYFNDDALIDLSAIATVNGTPLATLQQTRVPFFLQSADAIVLKSGSTLAASVLDPNFYQLIHTNDTLDTRDDQPPFKPAAIRYFPEAGRVSLIYDRNLDELRHPVTGVILPAVDLRLRVGTNESAPLPPVAVNALAVNPGDTFGTAMNLGSTWTPGNGGSQAILIDAEIKNQTPLLLDFPGGSDEPGGRYNRFQDNLRLIADNVDGTSVVYYNFQSLLGRLGTTNLSNAITEQQRLRVREVMSLYERYLGVRFVESTNRGFTVAVGDHRAVRPFEDVAGSGQPGVVEVNAVGGTYYEAGYLQNGQLAAVLDIQDFSNATLNEVGGPFQRAAMQAVGRLMGLGLADEVHGFTVQAFNSALVPGVGSDIVLPGDVDIVHGQYLYRPDSKDIDLYQFRLPVAGRITIETFAERMSQASLLDTTIRLYQQNAQGGWVEIAANDDYYSSDSFVQLDLQQGNYIVGVSASGNNTYDPTIADSGLGGRSQGSYQLRMDFRPPAQSVLRDSTGLPIDGDSSGEAGGVFNFWFRPAGPANTKFVDKVAPVGGSGTLAAPYRNIHEALTAAQPGDVVRIVGNAGADGSLATLADNLAYEIGFDSLGRPLPDGATFDVPRGVTVMIDAAAVLKMRRSRVGIGSSSTNVDRSGGSLLVLGTPKLVNQAGGLVRDASGQPVIGSVYFTSASDPLIGKNANTLVVGSAANAGDWGGIDFRHRVDSSDPARVNNEAQGQFLNWVAHADVRYGGGQVVVDGVSQVITPIQMIDARPTIGNSRITHSADAAMSATPNSFRENNFQSPAEQHGSGGTFSVDYDRVGPAIHYNQLVNNSINGLQVRVRTNTSTQLETMTIPGRFDDTDIVHFVPENLVIAGTPGGAVLINEAPSIFSVAPQWISTGNLLPGLYNYRVTRVVGGVEGAPSEPTSSVFPSNTLIPVFTLGSVSLTNLPTGYNRIYRSSADGQGPYVLVADFSHLSSGPSSFIDTGTDLGLELADDLERFRTRPDARLAVDPGTIVKLQGSRIDAAWGGQLIAEGRDGLPVVFTALMDHRYGAGGTFNTGSRSTPVVSGDWGGIYVGQGSKTSLDYTVVAYGGGATRVEGGFSDFAAVEVHQGDLRLTNSRLENNANGATASNDPLRSGRGWNSPATVFIRGAQPIIAQNIIHSNLGPAISANVNALNYQTVVDSGRSRGLLSRVESTGNYGPLVTGNRLADNAINGMVIRGGVMTTEGIWDDTDIVHVVLDEIIASDHNHYSGLRLTSRHGQSLVVKFKGEQAGLTATGLPIDNARRIGGSVQIVGLPNYPVVLTSLDDSTVGAGFTPSGAPQRHTVPVTQAVGARLPTGPEVNNGLLIDNDVDRNTPGYFGFDVGPGGRSNFAGSGGITALGNSRLLINSNVLFAHTNFIDVGANGQAIDLASTTITTPPTLISPDFVISEGNLTGANGLINWRVETWMDNGIARLNNRIILTSTGALGSVRVINYLDEDVEGISDDLLYVTGTPGEADFRVFTLDGPERVGFSHGGVYSTTPGQLENANYVGWAADRFNNLQTAIVGTGASYSLAGNINTANLVPFIDAQLGQVYGLADVTSAFAWDVQATANRSVVTSFLELIPRNPSSSASAGDWRGILLDTYSNDRNLAVVVENESSGSRISGTNNTTFSAQYLGGIARREKSDDENRRLGFHVLGNIAHPGDVDVYSFLADAGSEVWLDIDRTDNSLDTVVELVSADGRTLALSMNSLAEEADPSLLFRAADMPQFSVNPLRKSMPEFYYASAQGAPKDLNSTNPRDAGMRVVLPGNPGGTNLYHVRVRSSSLRDGDPISDLLTSASVGRGLTTGSYLLQIRLGQDDEVPGSGVSYADIRYATNGLHLRGVPSNSPLLGEIGEIERSLTGPRNDTFANAQPIGNLLATNRQALSVSGALDNLNDVDWYRFDLQYQRITPSGLREYFATIFDVDYADGIGRPDTSIYLFNAAGTLILSGLSSGHVDDQASAVAGQNHSDLSRGSFGNLDPLVGAYELPVGTYYVAVTNLRMVPAVMSQYTDPNSPFSRVRLQPIDSLQLIAEDHVNFSIGSTGLPPVMDVLFDPIQSVVPFDLSDMVMYVTQNVGRSNGVELTNVYLVNPFTGEVRNQFGRVAGDIQDLTMRVNGQMQAFDRPRTAVVTQNGDRDTFLNYFTVNPITEEVSSADATLDTFSLNQALDAVIDSNDGWNPEALTFGRLGDRERGFIVASRPTPAGVEPSYSSPRFITDSDPPLGQTRPGVTRFTNVIFEINPNDGQAISFDNDPGFRREGNARGVGVGSSVVERGYIDTFTRDLAGNAVTRASQLVGRATTAGSAGSSPDRIIRDGNVVSLIDSTNFVTRFEFNFGPEVEVRYNPAQGISVADGRQFILDGVTYEFDLSLGGPSVTPGAVGIRLAPGASLQQFVDAIAAAMPSNITVSFHAGRMNFSGATTGAFTQLVQDGVFVDFGSSGNVAGGNISVNVLASDTAQTVAQRLAVAINQSGIPGLSATTSGDTLQLVGALVLSAGPLHARGVAPGGIITGAAMIGNRMYAVSDTGGLFFVDNPSIPRTGNVGTYVNSSYALTGIQFSSLVAGPANVSGGQLTQILFGLDTSGNVHAFDTNGVPQRVFANGATRISTGLTSATGLTFSTLNTNLWHTTGRRADDPGHGLEQTSNNSRIAETGGSSFYFGLENTGSPNHLTYNFPGGAAGALESLPFNLRGVSAGDQPTLYFNYFFASEGAASDLPLGSDANDYMRDSFRVYVAGEDGRWILTATNNDPAHSIRNNRNFDDELDLSVSGNDEVQRLFDNTGQWRQARIPLHLFAGQDNVKIRIEFASAGGFGYGLRGGKGPEIRTVGANRLSDGQALLLNGQRFEIEMGVSLILPSGSAVRQGDAVTIDGTRFVFTTGAPVSAPDVAVVYSPAMSAEQLATALQQAILTRPASGSVISGLSFTSEQNDIITKAQASGADGSSMLISGTGRIGDNAALSNAAMDVDMVRVFAHRGATVIVQAQATPGSSLDTFLRVFDGQGQPLRRTDGSLVQNDNAPGTTNSLLSFTAPADGTYFIGVSSAGNSNYGATVAGTAATGSSTGDYVLQIGIQRMLSPVVAGSRLQLEGASTVQVAPGAAIATQGALGSGGVPVRITADMNAAQVAVALQRALADHFAGGATTAYPIRGGDTLSVTGLVQYDSFNPVTLQPEPSSFSFDPGPFGANTTFVGDAFSAFNAGTRFDGTTDRFFPGSLQGRNNAHEGVLVDDFIIGLAGRGEMVLGPIVGSTDFIVDPQYGVTNPRRDTRGIEHIYTGPYQLEVRGGDEYGVPRLPGLETTIRYVDSKAIDSLLSPGVAIKFNDAAALIAGTTFTVSDGTRVVTFELDDVNDSLNVQPGRVAFPFNTAVVNQLTGSVTAESAQTIAARFRDLVNGTGIQSFLADVSANLLNNDRMGATSDTVVMIGQAVLQIPDSLGELIISRGRGGANRERPQGQIVIESARVSNSLEFGALVTSSLRDPITNAPITGTPRNTVTINDEQLVPGAVIMNSEFLFNRSGGISVVGDAGGANLPPASVPFVRLVNNTILGGSLSAVAEFVPTIHSGFVFDIGNLAFADAVVRYSPLIGGGPGPIAGLDDPNVALGPPSAANNGEPAPGGSAVSLGRGGQLVLQFADNLLTGSGNADPDLVVFEVGDSEEVLVEVSADGLAWTAVGRASAAVPALDIDAFGFNRNSRLAFVRLTDIAGQGTQSGNSVGADIDAVGALSSVAVDRYAAGGTGISVTSNATATLLNNVLINNAAGIHVDNSSRSTVIGGSLYQRNTANVTGVADLGRLPIVSPNTATIYISPGIGNLFPAMGSPVIDSSIDSLEDRPSLVAVKQPLGYTASPILAPRLDINGQLRVDDPTVETPAGVGENAFKDRGARERGDLAGPLVVMLSPGDNDVAGLDRNSDPTIVELIGATPQYFDLRLIDGLEPTDPMTGSGINHDTVSASSVLVYRNGAPLAEGIDYRFGYDSTNGVIRLQPLAGIWRGQSVYTIRLVNSKEAAVVAHPATAYQDGDQFQIVDAVGSLTKFEIDLGLRVIIPSSNGVDAALEDGATFAIDDGTRRIVFEIDNNGPVGSGNRVVTLPVGASLLQATQALIAAIGQSELQLDVRQIAPGRLQIQGASAVKFETLTSGLAVTGQTGVQRAFGLQIPLVAGVPSGLADGQTFTIDRSGSPVTFELDTNNNAQPGNTPVRFTPGASANQIGAALVSAINSAGLGLAASYDGNGAVRLGGDANTKLSLSNTVLTQIGIAGQPPAVAISVPADATASEVAALIRQAITNAGLTGVTLTTFGNRLLIEGAQGVSGAGAGQIGAIRDMAGNALRPNQVDGTTILTVFLGEGFDYGDAPAPYLSLHADNGPRHQVVDGLSLGATVTADADARVPNADVDDGLQIGVLNTAFQSSAQISVTNTTGRQAYASLWIDFNGDGFFSDAEKIMDAEAVGSGVTTVSFLVPATANRGNSYARVRLSTDRDAIGSPIGEASDGEVEDWPVEIRANPFTNPVWNLDVNASGLVSSIDALQVINWLNDPARPNDLASATVTNAPPYVDVNGDGRVTALDALLVINYLNSRPAAAGEGEGLGQGEGEAVLPPATGVQIAIPTSSSPSPTASTSSSQVVMAGDWIHGLLAGNQATPGQEQTDARLVRNLGDVNNDLHWLPEIQWSEATEPCDLLWEEIGSQAGTAQQLRTSLFGPMQIGDRAAVALRGELEEAILDDLLQ